MVLNERPLKRVKRALSGEHHDFLTFPKACSGDGPFRSNIRFFLKKNARTTLTPSLFPCLLTYQMSFRVGDAQPRPQVVVLDIVEEDVTRSRSVYCDQCRVVGWSNHPVCSKRYHFIIRADGYQKPCSRCGDSLQLLDSRCESCNSEITAEEIEDWIYHQCEDASHLLHGLVHSNGYGHLLTVNGKEGGSKLLTGCDIMDFWDRLCNCLAVRKVTVMDVSRKYGMEYRLLHAVAKGRSWYGEWGYEFGSGSYALTISAYQNAVHSLASLPLSAFYQHHKPITNFKAIVAFYQTISHSELVNLGDIFSLLLELIQKDKRHVSQRTKPPEGEWSDNDMDYVQQSMIKVLRAAAAAGNFGWVRRRALRGSVCNIGSQQLLDHCLNNISGKYAPGGMMVLTRFNHSLNSVEYKLEPHNSDSQNILTEVDYPLSKHIIDDLKLLYHSIFEPEDIASYCSEATRHLIAQSVTKLLDCKQFIKDYSYGKNLPIQFTMILCHVVLADHPKDIDPSPPPELLILDPNSTVVDLKVEATKAFQEVYAILKRFQAEELLDYGPVHDSMTVKLLFGSHASVRIWGRCPGMQSLYQFRVERGTENWTVDCICGAKDDDGERMLACDTCGVWLHMRCVGIHNFDSIPAKFVCIRCQSEPNLLSPMDDPTKNSRNNCRDEVVASNSASARASLLPMAFDIR